MTIITPQIREDLLGAASYIERHGLCQSGVYFDDDSACAMGAVYATVGGFAGRRAFDTMDLSDWKTRRVREVRNYLADYLYDRDGVRYAGVYAWSDTAPDQATVISTLREAANAGQ